MSSIIQRTAGFLWAERSKLIEELKEVDLLLELLDQEVGSPAEPNRIVTQFGVTVEKPKPEPVVEPESGPVVDDVPQRPEPEPVGVKVEFEEPPVDPRRVRYSGMSRKDVQQEMARQRRAIVESLDRNGGATPAELMGRLGLTRPQVERKLRELFEEGRLKRRRAKKGHHGFMQGKSPYVYTLAKIVEEREHHLDEKTRIVLD